jgi:hypothetical protein
LTDYHVGFATAVGYDEAMDPASCVDLALANLAEMLYISAHDGFWIEGKEPWEQEDFGFERAWKLLIIRGNSEEIRKRMDAAQTAEWKRWLREAYRQCLEREAGSSD